MSKNVVSVDAKKLASFLSKINLNGLLNECILQCGEEFVSASSIDPSNIIFLSVQEDIDISPLGDLGLGDIGIISKFVGDCPTEELKLVRKDNRIVIVHSGIELQYLLTDTSLITTSVEYGKLDEIINNCGYAFKLTKEVKESFLYTTNLLRVKTASIVVENKVVFLTGGLANEHSFRLEAGELEDFSEDPSFTESFVCSFYADYIKAVFSVLDFKKGEEPMIIFSPDYPMVVQEANNSWAVFPLT
jgi:hypothetical protein